MAIKIIVEGKLPNPVVFVGKCDNCKCEVECDITDILVRRLPQECIDCPTCKDIMHVAKDKYR